MRKVDNLTAILGHCHTIWDLNFLEPSVHLGPVMGLIYISHTGRTVLLSRAGMINSWAAGHMSGPSVFSNTSTYAPHDKQNLSDMFFVNFPSTGEVSKPIFEL